MSINMGSKNDNSEDDGLDNSTGTMTKTRSKTQKPSLYKVILLNDDFTPMEFVIDLLKGVFRLTTEEATSVMLSVHNKGVGVCGIFTLDIAETKVNLVMDQARKIGHPLQCTLEKD